MLESSFSKTNCDCPISIGVQFTFRWSAERIEEPSNGNFLGLVELLTKFDQVMGKHFDVLPMQNS